MPQEDMPYLPDGTPLDIVLNPLGVPSRIVLCGNDQSKGIPDNLFGKKNAWQRGGTVAFYQRSR